MIREKIKKKIYENPERFPFEWIRSYQERISYCDKLEMTDDEKKEYLLLITDSKKICEYLMEREPQNKNAPLWNEALQIIDELNTR